MALISLQCTFICSILFIDNWTANSRTATEKDRFFNSSTFDKQTFIPIAASSSQINHIQSQNSNSTFSQSQRGPLTPCTKFNQSDYNDLGINQSQTVSHTHSSQSKPPAERNLNTTCGNCGEKGHTRVNPNCPKYHTADESARREASTIKHSLIFLKKITYKWILPSGLIH